jgi:hypothetical protein
MTPTKGSVNQSASDLHYGPETRSCPTEYLPDLIRKYAYRIFEDHDRQTGHELEDRLQPSVKSNDTLIFDSHKTKGIFVHS